MNSLSKFDNVDESGFDKPPKRKGFIQSLREDENESRIRTFLKSDDVLMRLESEIDTTKKIKTFGRIPGSKPYLGEVLGSNFRLSRKNHALNPFARKLEGRVVEEDGSTSILYRFVPSFFSRFFDDTLLALLVISAILSAMVLILCLLVPEGDSSPFLDYLMVAPVILVFSIVVSKLGANASFTADEEILEDLKRIACGIDIRQE